MVSVTDGPARPYARRLVCTRCQTLTIRFGWDRAKVAAFSLCLNCESTGFRWRQAFTCRRCQRDTLRGSDEPNELLTLCLDCAELEIRETRDGVALRLLNEVFDGA